MELYLKDGSRIEVRVPEEHEFVCDTYVDRLDKTKRCVMGHLNTYFGREDMEWGYEGLAERTQRLGTAADVRILLGGDTPAVLNDSRPCPDPDDWHKKLFVRVVEAFNAVNKPKTGA